ncbi:CDP-alcohol phosphatidyltransferase family protein [Wukongibacter baidiensis]|uniref:CDP-alcohol phosphatidyltransferase family protein n=1 Tax=Wukongibacter baidiensis TaxID=1723361 RepID=UPI003D7F1E9F
MKQIANYISTIRIFLALTLIWIEPLSREFIIIYLACGISDIVDGYIARRTGTVSEIGGKIDSIADLIFFGVLIIIVYPIITLSLGIIIWIVIISAIRLVSIMIVFMKYKTFGVLHTYGNKITGIALFILPLILVFDQLYALIYIVCVIASVASIEELLINLTSTEFEINKRSIIGK